MIPETLNKPFILDNPFVQQDEMVYKRCIEEADNRLISENVGYLGAESVSWKIFREPCILLGGFRAVMLQMAHPAVAQGVEQSSSFRYDVFGRARRTMTTMYSLIFGSRATALKASRTMFSMHHRVQGIVPTDIDSSWAGQHFRANDPRLLDWVGLTTLNSVLIIFETLIRPLTEEERIRFAYECQTIALLCGLPLDYHRETLEEFDLSMDAMFAGDQLAMGDVALGIVYDLFDVIPVSLDERLTVGFLPQCARDLYQIQWTEKDKRSFENLKRRVTFINQSFPAALRYVPAYRKAKGRISRRAQKLNVGRGEAKETNYYLSRFGFSAGKRTQESL